MSVQTPVCEEDTVIHSGTQGSLHFIVCDYHTVKINTNVGIIKLSCYHYCSLWGRLKAPTAVSQGKRTIIKIACLLST